MEEEMSNVSNVSNDVGIWICLLFNCFKIYTACAAAAKKTNDDS